MPCPSLWAHAVPSLQTLFTRLPTQEPAHYRGALAPLPSHPPGSSSRAPPYWAVVPGPSWADGTTGQPLGTQADKQLKKIKKPSFKMIFLNPKEEKMTKALCLLTWVAFWEAFGKGKKKKSCGFNWWYQKYKPIPGALFKFHSVIFFLIHFYSRCSLAAILKLRLKVILIAGVITGSCSNRVPWIQKKNKIKNPSWSLDKPQYPVRRRRNETVGSIIKRLCFPLQKLSFLQALKEFTLYS